MLDRASLRQMAKTMPVVKIDAATLMALLDEAERSSPPAKARAAREPREASPDDEKCAYWLFGVVRQTAPAAREPSFSTWANDVRLMRERDGRTLREICELFQWAHSDSFWCLNILCPKKLREKWDRLALQRERTSPGLRTVPSLGKAGAATAQNAARWLEEHSDAA